MAKFKIQKSATVNQYFDATNVVGGTGGLTSISGNQVQPQVRTGGSQTTGSILRSKGRGKFLVTDGSTAQVCTLVNKATGLASGEMSITANVATIATGAVTEYAGAATTTAYVTFLNANVTGPNNPSVGQTLLGTGLTGTVTVSAVSRGATSSNLTVTISSQSVSNVAAASLTVQSNIARLTNKFATDFGGNKALWTFSSPTATTIKLPGA